MTQDQKSEATEFLQSVLYDMDMSSKLEGHSVVGAISNHFRFLKITLISYDVIMYYKRRH